MSSQSQTQTQHPLAEHLLGQQGLNSTFRLLSGRMSLTGHSLNDTKAKALLERATPQAFARKLAELEKCAQAFARVCLKNERVSLERTAQPGYLQRMAQAMPYGERMPVSFHNARWPFQFVFKEACEQNPRGETAQGALAKVRHEQAVLLQQHRRMKRQGKTGDITRIARNAKLLAPFEPLRHEMRNEALQAGGKRQATRLVQEVLAKARSGGSAQRVVSPA